MRKSGLLVLLAVGALGCMSRTDDAAPQGESTGGTGGTASGASTGATGTGSGGTAGVPGTGGFSTGGAVGSSDAGAGGEGEGVACPAVPEGTRATVTLTAGDGSELEPDVPLDLLGKVIQVDAQSIVIGECDLPNCVTTTWTISVEATGLAISIPVDQVVSIRALHVPSAFGLHCRGSSTHLTIDSAPSDGSAPEPWLFVEDADCGGPRSPSFADASAISAECVAPETCHAPVPAGLRFSPKDWEGQDIELDQGEMTTWSLTREEQTLSFSVGNLRSYGEAFVPDPMCRDVTGHWSYWISRKVD